MVQEIKENVVRAIKCCSMSTTKASTNCEKTAAVPLRDFKPPAKPSLPLKEATVDDLGCLSYDEASLEKLQSFQ